MYELFAIAGVVIGGASLMGGKGSIVGSCIGAVMIRLLEKRKKRNAILDTCSCSRYEL